MKNILRLFSFLLLTVCFTSLSAQKITLTDEEQKIVDLINDIRENPKKFGEKNKKQLEKEWPEFYQRLLKSPKLKPLSLECTYMGFARMSMGKPKISKCTLPNGETCTQTLIDEHTENFGDMSPLQILSHVSFNVLEPNPKYMGICFVKSKGITLAMGNYNGEKADYHNAEQKLHEDYFEKDKNLTDICQAAIERSLLRLINEERKTHKLEAIIAAPTKNKIGAAAWNYTSEYFKTDYSDMKKTEKNNLLISKASDWSAKWPDYRFNAAYKKLSMQEQMLDTATIARMLFEYLLPGEKKEKLMHCPTSKEIGIRVTYSGINGCVMATLMQVEPNTQITEVPVTTAHISTVNPAPKTDFDKIEIEVIRLMNEERARLGLKAVSWCPEVWKACEFHSKYMGETGHFSHSQKNKSTAQPWDRVAKYVVKKSYNTVMENIQYYSDGFVAGKDIKGQAMEVFMNWKNSPGHYKNMINKNINTVAVAGFLSGDNYYWTMVGIEYTAK